MREIQFLHIGKCAGTQIASLAEKINAMRNGIKIVKHRHHVTLAALPRDAEYFFSIRSPETRFISGFYSRKRNGRPRFDFEWTPSEREAFSSFHHANDLAEALFIDGAAGRLAFAAMQSIRHIAINQSDYFKHCGDFLNNRAPVTIIRQEYFERDIGVLAGKLGLDVLPPLETDPVAAHKNDYAGLRPLSELAKENLRKWYAQDFEFYRHCSIWLERQT
jgi:hypothetical protein